MIVITSPRRLFSVVQEGNVNDDLRCINVA